MLSCRGVGFESRRGYAPVDFQVRARTVLNNLADGPPKPLQTFPIPAGDVNLSGKRMIQLQRIPILKYKFIIHNYILFHYQICNIKKIEFN